MGYDPYSPISPAHVNVLCLPASRITPQRFEEFLRALNAFSTVRAKAVESSGSLRLSKFSSGSILLNFSSTLAVDANGQSQSLESNRDSQIILGLVDGESLPKDPSQHTEVVKAIQSDFHQYASSYGHAQIWTVVIFGGRTPLDADDVAYIDLDGDGPTIGDVVANLASRFQSALVASAEDLSSRAGTHASMSANPSDKKDETHADSQGTFKNNSATRTNGSIDGNIAQPSQYDADTLVALGLGCLQIGQWPDALRYLSEGITEARDSGDHFSHAKALEGLLVCMLLFAWSKLDFNIPQVCYPEGGKNGVLNMSHSTSALIQANRSVTNSLSASRSVSSALSLTLLLPNLISNIVGLHERAIDTAGSTLPFTLVCEARIRWINLLIVMRRHGNILGDGVLQALIEPEATPMNIKSSDVSATALTLPKSALVETLIDSALEAQTKLSIQQAATIYISVARSLASLGVERKQGFYLKDFLHRLSPALLEARRLGAAELGVHPASSLPALTVQRHGLDHNANRGIRLLLNMVANIYGLPTFGSDQESISQTATDRLQKFLSFWSAVHSVGDVMMKLEVLGLCIEVSDALPDPAGSLGFMSQLLSASLRTLMVRSFVENSCCLINTSDQSRLLHNMRRAVHAASKSGLGNVRAEYWDKFLLRDIRVLEESNSTKLIPRTPQDLSLAVDSQTETKKDPFIFNPFARAKESAGVAVLMVGEMARFSVTLQNALDVEMEIEEISLSTEGCSFNSSRHSIVLGPLCTQTFTLTGTPENTGSLKVTGCKATIRGCYDEEFLILRDEWRLPREVKSRSHAHSSNSISEIRIPEITTISLKVIDTLPSLSVSATSLIQPSVMLLEGESTQIQFTLRNNSHKIDVDFVLLTFEDSVSKRLEEALGNKDLSPADVYEIQHQIASRPVVQWKRESHKASNIKIPAGSDADFTVEIFGTPGLTEVKILVDYAFLGIPRGDIRDTFYTRQLSWTLATTVNGSIDVPRCLAQPVDGALGWNYEKSQKGEHTDRMFVSSGGDDQATSKFLLLLDVRNIWPQPLEVTFDVHQTVPKMNDSEEGSPTDISSDTETLQPGQMSRILLLVPRVRVTDPHAAIPSLDTKRQFVVSATKMSIEAELATRESFWYREKLLYYLKASWKEQCGSRTGQLDLRKCIRTNPRMIDALRVDDIEISFLLEHASSMTKDDNADTVVQLGHSHFRLSRNCFARLTAKVKNNTTQGMSVSLRLQPSIRHQPHNIALDLSKRFAWTGVLQRALHPAITADETREADLGIVALAIGQYEVNATVEEICRPTAPMAGLSALGSASSERRIWHARYPCLIDVVDEEDSPS